MSLTNDHSFRAQDKLAFLLAFVPYLVENSPVLVDEAAHRFGVTPEFVRDIVRLIAVSGVPGETRSYQPEDLFDIAWDALEERDEIVLTQRVAIDDSPRFSAREAAALIAGLHYLSAIPENANRPAISRLLAKLSRGTSGPPSQVMVAPSATNATLNLIRQSVAAGTGLAFDYVTSRGEQERRTVDPILVESVDHDWYLRAWDHSRLASRTFRLDRMSHVTPTNVLVGDHSSEVDVSERLFEPSEDNIVITVDLAVGVVPFVREWLMGEPQQTDREGVLRGHFRVAHFHGLKRVVAEYAGLITVVAPQEAREAVIAWARAGATQYAL